MVKRLFLMAVLLMAFTAQGFAQQKRESMPLEHGAHRIGKRTDADMQRWREHGLGQFIHWGVYAIAGGHWNGEYYGGAAEWIRSWNKMPKDTYDNLYKEFDPVGFDAKKWAKQAADMGCKYMIFTTKHHDGFCLWPSKYTGYTVAGSPYKRDIVKQVVDAYTAEGIDVHLYFSIIDWNHPGYRSGAPSNDAERASYEEFKTFTRNQLLELLDNYPAIKGLWFDGSWDRAWIEEAAWVDELGKELRAKHPGLVIGSRFRADENGRRHYDSNGDLIDDYDQTWERSLPNSIADLKGNDWDCVMTVPENQWGYHSDWRGYIKTSYDLIEMMVRAVSMDGNFVVNFGPDGKGNIRPEETKIAAEMGRWMKINSEAIYGCSHVNIKQQGWGYFTGKDNKVYMNVFNRPISDKLFVEISKDSPKPVKAYLLEDGKKIEIISGGRNKSNDYLYYMAIPEGFRADQPFVIVLEMENATKGDEGYQQALT